MRFPRVRLTVWVLMAMIAVLSLVFSYSVQAWGKSKSARDYRSKVMAFAYMERKSLESQKEKLSALEQVHTFKPEIKTFIQNSIAIKIPDEKILDAAEKDKIAREICIVNDMISPDELSYTKYLIEIGELTKKAAFYGRLKLKYERALKRPWESISPDPPWPLD